jgi:hypothetical protein
MVSFTGVVGYQTTKSSTIAKASPLFIVRTRRAIDMERKDIVCDYVGKGEEFTISTPIYNSRNKQLQKVINVISKMNEANSKDFLNLVIKQIQNDKAQKDVNINEVIYTFNQIRNNPDRIIFDYSRKNIYPTLFPIFCFIITIIGVIFLLVMGVVIRLLVGPITCDDNCKSLKL